jgi:hypothetical protein
MEFLPSKVASGFALELIRSLEKQFFYDLLILSKMLVIVVPYKREASLPTNLAVFLVIRLERTGTIYNRVLEIHKGSLSPLHSTWKATRSCCGRSVLPTFIAGTANLSYPTHTHTQNKSFWQSVPHAVIEICIRK